MDKEKIQKHEILEVEISKLEEKINSLKPVDDAKFRELKEQVIKLQEEIDEQKNVRELLDEKKGKEIKQLEDTLSQAIEEEKNSKKSIEQSFLK